MTNKILSFVPLQVLFCLLGLVLSVPWYNQIIFLCNSFDSIKHIFVCYRLLGKEIMNHMLLLKKMFLNMIKGSWVLDGIKYLILWN